MSKQVVLIPGEDAAAEAFHESVSVLDCLNAQFDLGIEWIRPPVGQAGIDQFDDPFPEQAKHAIDHSDATLFGATSGKSGRALRYLRWGLESYANVRPVRWFPGCNSPLLCPEGIDLAIVRENMEDVYIGVEGELKELESMHFTSWLSNRPINELGEGRFGLKVYSEKSVTRIVKYACELALKRAERSGRDPSVACGTKHNISPVADGYFRKIARDTIALYPEITYRSLLADDLVHQLIINPQQFDVVVLPNLFGDLFSDATAALVGGLGLAPSGCFGDNGAYFEAVHGTAPDIVGKNIINPTATILSAAMMLEYLGFEAPCQQLVSAVEEIYAEGIYLTPDQGGTSTTSKFCEALKQRITRM